MPTFGEPAEPMPTFGEPDLVAGSIEPVGGGMDAAMFNTDLGPLAKWRTEREEKLAEKAAATDAALKQKIDEAQQQITQFYAELKDKSEKRAQANL